MIDIQDQLHTFDEAQIKSLHDRASAYPFDLKVLVSDGTLPKPAFEAQVASRVTGLHQVSIGVDPKHRFTFVRGSKDLGLPSGPEIASAGNAFFKKGDLVGGIDAIAARASDLRVQSRVVQSQTGTPIVVHDIATSAGVWWLLGGLGALVIAVVAYVLWRSRRNEERTRALQAELNNEVGDLRLRRAERGATAEFDARLNESYRTRSAAPAAAYSSAQAPVVINNQPAGRDVLTDLLLIDAINRPERVVEHTRVVERDSSSSSWDSSGGDSSSGSSWDSSSDSSSSSDYSGGSDSGGGGFDSGGGGSDW